MNENTNKDQSGGSSNNVVRFPVEQTRLPGESRVQHNHRLEAFAYYDKMGAKNMDHILAEICEVIEEFEEQESEDAHRD